MSTLLVARDNKGRIVSIDGQATVAESLGLMALGFVFLAWGGFCAFADHVGPGLSFVSQTSTSTDIFFVALGAGGMVFAAMPLLSGRAGISPVAGPGGVILPRANWLTASSDAVSIRGVLVPWSAVRGFRKYPLGWPGLGADALVAELEDPGKYGASGINRIPRTLVARGTVLNLDALQTALDEFRTQKEGAAEPPSVVTIQTFENRRPGAAVRALVLRSSVLVILMLSSPHHLL